MKLSGTLFASIMTVLGALCLSGCLALAVPSLAYQGYKYEKGKNQNQQTSTQTSKSKSTSSNTSDQYYDTE